LLNVPTLKLNHKINTIQFISNREKLCPMNKL
jgi:hypothetical protein